jgi:hypothetical protein
MSSLAPWVVLVVGIVVLVISVLSGQRSGFGLMQVIGIVIGVGGVLVGLRWRRRLAGASRA